MEKRTSGRLRVLLVDDDELIRRAAARSLEALLGCVVETASTGYEAIALVMFGEGYDVAVVDLEMPGMNGRDVIKLLKNLAPDLPAGIWSGATPLREGELPEASFVVRKWQPIDELAEAVERAAARNVRTSTVRLVGPAAAPNKKTNGNGNGH
ncbi:MAG: response regulator transcription factor [Sandaracinaceae bacterium]